MRIGCGLAAVDRIELANQRAADEVALVRERRAQTWSGGGATCCGDDGADGSDPAKGGRRHSIMLASRSFPPKKPLGPPRTAARPTPAPPVGSRTSPQDAERIICAHQTH